MAYDDFQIPTCPLTPDDVFAVIVELSRHALPDDVLQQISFATTLREWDLMMFDELDVPQLGKNLNEFFDMDIPASQWAEALAPSQSRTLGDLCNLVAVHARIPCIEPVTVMGDRSHAAGAFLVLRRILQDAGIDVSDLRPSSPIGPYLRERWNEIVLKLRVLAPGRLPPVVVDAPAHLTCGIGIIASWITLVIGLTGILPRSTTLGAGLAFAGFFIAFCALNTCVKASNVRIGNTRTIRELCQVLVGERVAWPGFPVSTTGTTQ
jgi:hypothetical protein